MYIIGVDPYKDTREESPVQTNKYKFQLYLITIQITCILELCLEENWRRDGNCLISNVPPLVVA